MGYNASILEMFTRTKLNDTRKQLRTMPAPSDQEPVPIIRSNHDENECHEKTCTT